MRIIICDDDRSYAKKCSDQILLLAQQRNIEVKIELVESGENLLFFKDTKFANVDLIYLDWHMPQYSGFEVAQKLRDHGAAADIIFYTVDDSHAVDGYDVEALHYIVKEKTSWEKFEEIFLKAAERAEHRHVELLSVSCAGEHRNIPTKDILYFEVKNRIVTVFYYFNKEVRSFEFYSSLSKIAEFLYGKYFVRIHSSYLIGTRFIRKKTAQQVEMENGQLLPIGGSYRGKV